ncbi:thiamine ABC transporter substrate-binding protein [Deinococcus irradiatisoli]|uniref:Thiamine ABC transporter substrate-binding protein n=1 Tax=Deinococcus irradiatisoli TaxID=2202254 RepID=A0A2Z3JQF1_9DEIO|nr:thiamine ABC transporter substrate-binding protein [Deinococcus irradiatisoli]AWN23658.1 thiamine ABC transporter substrate-binding protein [Deinococcus irradiatisoli]
MHRTWTFSLLCGLLLGAAQAAPTTLTVITHDSFDVDKKLIAAFEIQNNAKVRFIKGGDAGEMLNRLILTKANPIADAVYGLDNTLAPRAMSAGLLEAYKSPALANVPAAERLDAFDLNTVDAGYVAFNYDRAWFAKAGLALPKTLDDLKSPTYAKLTVVPSPATSSPGLAFLLASVNHYGQTQALEWWKEARRNGLKVTRGWTDAYDKEFSRNGGQYPIVLSYASSPAAEVFYAENYDPKKLPAESPTGNLLLPGSIFLQLEGAGVLKGAKQPTLARKFVDFMLSAPVQADFPTRMWVYPALSGVKLDPVYQFAQKPSEVKALTPVNTQPLVDVWVREVLRAR